jgi:hypothetical protein
VRQTFLFMLGAILTGCASQPGAMQASNNPHPINQPPITGGASALVFDAPITLGEPEIVVSRDDRGAAAFWGFEDQSSSAYDILTYNRTSTDRGDRYVQDSITEKTGVVQR